MSPGRNPACSSGLAALVLTNSAVLAGLLILVEAALRLAAILPPISTIAYENDPECGPWAIPSQVATHRTECSEVHSVHINEHGMRDRPRSLLEKRGTRIALLGDSYVQGLQVADDLTVSSRMEALSAGAAEVLNFGVSSVGTSVELLIYRHRVRSFRPDVVVLALYLGNDISDNLPALKRKGDPWMAPASPYLLLDAEGRLRPDVLRGEARRTSSLRRLAERSAVGQWLVHSLRQWRAPGGGRGTAPPSEAGEGSENLYREAWRITEAVLERLAVEVRNDGAAFVLAVIPADMTMIDQGRTDGMTPAAVDRLRGLAGRVGFPMLDLTRPFLDAVRTSGVPLTFPCDAHWNARGHEAAARAIWEFLGERNFVPQAR